MNRFMTPASPIYALVIAWVTSACGSPVEDLAGRWELVAVNDVPVAEVPPIRVGMPRNHPEDWLEEKLVSRTVEIFEEEGEFFDRSVARIRQANRVDTVRHPDGPRIGHSEIVDTLLLTGTLEIEGDTIGFRASPMAGRIQHYRSDHLGVSPQESRGAVPVRPLGSGARYVLVGTREENRLRLQSPDGTELTFERLHRE